MERLRYIHHLGTGFLIYPGATHSRFEHSLGVMHLGTRIFNKLVNSDKVFWKDLDPDSIKIYQKTIRWACLLHDIGHLPFSHTLEEFCNLEYISKELEKIDFKEYKFDTKKFEQVHIDKKHELISSYLVLTEYSDILKKYGVDAKLVAALILGKIGETEEEKIKYLSVMRGILDSEIDVDKLDYLLRDNYMTGVNLVSIDVERMVSSYCIYGIKLHLNDRAISVIMNLLCSRDLMYLWVYQHHKVVFTECLLKTIIKRMCDIQSDFKKEYLSLESIKNLKDDYDIMTKIKECDDQIVKYYYHMLINRQYLSSCWKHRFDLDQICEPHIVDKLPNLLYNDSTKKELSDKICKELKIDEKDLLIAKKEFVPFTPKKADETYIIINRKARKLSSLKYISTNSETFGKTAYIYCPKEKKDELREWLNEGIKKYFPQYI